MISEIEELNAEIKALRARLSRLSEANLRINEDLDFDHVLREVLESARTLTAARYGVITVFDESGQGVSGDPGCRPPAPEALLPAGPVPVPVGLT